MICKMCKGNMTEGVVDVVVRRAPEIKGIHEVYRNPPLLSEEDFKEWKRVEGFLHSKDSGKDNVYFFCDCCPNALRKVRV